jgi:glycosyltransferase involved in cell wall biosynthesis
MKLLLLTQYFPPETGAPQNRLFELAVRLNRMGIDITVLTAMPNYPQMKVYKEYAGLDYHYEEMSGLKVHRSSIYVSTDRSIISRLRNYFSFVISSRRTAMSKLGDFDLIMCESPPLFLGYTAMYLARKKKAKLIFNVSDLWPESAEKLGVVNNKFLLNKAYQLEAKIYRRSDLVTGQTQGIVKSVANRFPGVKTFWLPNGADLSYYDPARIEKGNWREMNGIKEEDHVFLYAGIVGIAQGLEVILYAAERLKSDNCVFVILGSGPEKERLMQISRDAGLKNVKFLDAVGKTEMPSILKSVDAAIIPLKKLELFKGAIPSKIFEALAMEIPILLGVEGEARDLFIDKGQCGLFFEPQNDADLVKAIRIMISDKLKMQVMGKNGRKYVNENFNRDLIASKLYKEILSLSSMMKTENK